MFLKTLNISGSGLTAQQYRLRIIAENVTNVETTRTESGGPYQRKVPQFEAVDGNGSFIDRLRAKSVYIKPDLVSSYARNSTTYQGSGEYIANKYKNPYARVSDEAGVRVIKVTDDPTPGKMIYDPSHPDADEQGYVELPNVEIVQEMVNAMGASRSYEANVQVINAIKAMASRALEIGR